MFAGKTPEPVRRARTFAVFALALLLSLLVGEGYTRPRASDALLRWEPLSPVAGSPILFEVRTPAGVQSLSGKWMNHEISFFPAAKNGAAGNSGLASPDQVSRSTASRWYALAGVPLETSPGFYELKVTEALAGESREIVRKIRIGRARYPRVAVHVARRYTEPSPEQLREINADRDIKLRILATENPMRLWRGPFVSPVSAAISDVFGTERIFNNEVQSHHLGLDFAVPTGTPVDAINRGVVLLARPLYFEGNCIVLDHGQGLLSLYLHLSEFRVNEGEEVRTGQVIGLSGGTGRATGPHLHLAIRWEGVYLNPQPLFKLPLPTGI
jgi:murein DD-endopeptidase MepM/ murein hydrolase activator NlpD